MKAATVLGVLLLRIAAAYGAPIPSRPHLALPACPVCRSARSSYSECNPPRPPARPADCPASACGAGCVPASPLPPGDLPPESVPMFITLTNDDALTVVTAPIILNITDRHSSPNGCPMPATCARRAADALRCPPVHGCALLAAVPLHADTTHSVTSPSPLPLVQVLHFCGLHRSCAGPAGLPEGPRDRHPHPQPPRQPKLHADCRRQAVAEPGERGSKAVRAGGADGHGQGLLFVAAATLQLPHWPTNFGATCSPFSHCCGAAAAQTAKIPLEDIVGYRQPFLLFSPDQRRILYNNGFRCCTLAGWLHCC